MPGHWVFFTAFPWGHLRPESNLAVALARRFPDVIISVFVDEGSGSKSRGEMKRNVQLGNDDSVLSRIRLIPLGQAMAGMSPARAAAFATIDPRLVHTTSAADVEDLTAAFDAMMQERAFKDHSGNTWEPIEKPSLIICDKMMGDTCTPLKKKYGLPLYVWFVGSAAAATREYGATAMGGRAPTFEKECHAIEADPEKSKGKTFQQVAAQVWTYADSYKSDIIHIPGLAPIYQWEDVPQDLWFAPAYDSIRTGGPLLEVADGLLLPTVLDIEREGVEGVKDWFAGSSDRKVLCLGPQLPSDYFAPIETKKTSQMAGAEVQWKFPGATSLGKGEGAADTCITFLNNALDKYGVHSALYVSFGSIFFPRPDLVQILLERLLALERPMPFIFTTASPLAMLSEEMIVKVKESGRGLFVPWAPQQAILAHAALGAIMSHCGGGGTFESLSQGVPVIAWPFTFDQPQHALWMSEVLDTGFELLQVRNGPLNRKAYRGGPNGTEIVGTAEAIAKEIDEVLRACQGEEGGRKRANAEKVKQLIWDAHQPGGQIDQHLDVFKQYVTCSN
ncbi:glycosyltransferase family 1 protein [Calocera cornea HHB12733]|uniref:Glycosyltransferase family 1 protein n=1 Tax=Calocera cornea HHB12733 TaxID=1353952 RepID=A0A165FFE9_9BASI|nr:glycosyltransferase family 1 protein [Calocera cornea HHB12733]